MQQENLLFVLKFHFARKKNPKKCQRKRVSKARYIVHMEKKLSAKTSVQLRS